MCCKEVECSRWAAELSVYVFLGFCLVWFFKSSIKISLTHNVLQEYYFSYATTLWISKKTSPPGQHGATIGEIPTPPWPPKANIALQQAPLYTLCLCTCCPLPGRSFLSRHSCPSAFYLCFKAPLKIYQPHTLCLSLSSLVFHVPWGPCLFPPLRRKLCWDGE